MKKTLVLWALAALLFLPGCKKYALKEDLKSLESRVAALERLCDQMNGNIASLQTVVNALQNNDCVTSVVPVTENGKTVGYTINFAKSPSITIYHGADGKDGAAGKDGEKGADGYTPVIGVRQDTDGIWYWTLDGNWLTDDSGKRVRADGRDGTDGRDGVNGKDGADGRDGVNGKDGADGKDGVDGKDGADGKDADAAFFASVTEDEDYVYLLLSGSSEPIAIPKHHPLSVSFYNTEDIRVLPNKTYPIRYSITGADEHTVIKALAQDGFRAVVKAEGYSEGLLEITTPSTVLPSEVLVFVTDGKERTIMRSINFVEGVIIVSSQSYTIGYDGGTVSVEVSTNIEYAVEIPEEARSWISVELPTRAAMRQETLNFTVARNESLSVRYATVRLVDDLGVILGTVLITQLAEDQDGNKKEDSLEERLAGVDKESLEELKVTGHLDNADYAFIKTLPNLELLDLSELDDEELPAGCLEASNIPTVLLPMRLKKINNRAFYGAAITSLSLPETVETIGDYAFYNCSLLQGSLVIPDATRSIGEYCFSRSTFDGTLMLGKGLETIGRRAFSNCLKFTGDLIVPDSVTTLGEYAFYNAGFTGNLVVGNGVTEIPDSCFAHCKLARTLQLGENIVTIVEYAFFDCEKLSGNLVIPDSVQIIGRYAFSACRGVELLSLGRSLKTINDRAFSECSFSRVYCKATVVPRCASDAFDVYGSSWPGYLGVPIGCKNAYSKATGWGKFNTIEEINFD